MQVTKVRAGTPDVAEGVVNWRIEARNVSAEGDETRRDYDESWDEVISEG